MALYDALICWEALSGAGGPRDRDAVLRLTLKEGEPESLNPSDVRSASRSAVETWCGDRVVVKRVTLLRRLDLPPLFAWNFGSD